MPTIPQIVQQIRTAVFGKDVRESIAQGIEKCAETADAAVSTVDNIVIEDTDGLILTKVEVP